MAGNRFATAGQIVGIGSPADVAVSGDETLVTWQVEPDDDEGPYQGAWRLYGKKGDHVADGKFGIVHEASGRIEAWAIDGGFVMLDYRTHRLWRLDRRGELTVMKPSRLPAASLAGGQLIQADWTFPSRTYVLFRDGRLTELPDVPGNEAQDLLLDQKGELWALQEWQDKGPIRLAHAANGRPPWTTETVPVPAGSSVQSYSMSAADGRIFLPTTHQTGDRQPVDDLMVRPAGPTGDWSRIDTAGISDRLTVPPRIQAWQGHLLATAAGEGQWMLAPSARRWKPIKGVATATYSTPYVFVEGGRLWSAEGPFGNTLNYSTDAGATWHEFDR